MLKYLKMVQQNIPYCPIRNTRISDGLNRRPKLKLACVYFFNLIFIIVLAFLVHGIYNSSIFEVLKVKVLEESITDLITEVEVLKNTQKELMEKKEFDCQNSPQTQLLTENTILEKLEHFADGINEKIAATKRSVDQFIEVYINGKTQMKNTDILVEHLVNYALESLGATVVYTENPCLNFYQRIFAYFDNYFKFSNAPREILRQTLEPGTCYGFTGQQNIIVIKLAQHVTISKVSIDHILDTMSPSGEVSSAPNRFKVYGLIDFRNNKAKHEEFLGDFQYNINSRQHLQYFDIRPCKLRNSFQFVKFEIITNWGNLNHTCIYRVGVHGKLSI